MLPKRRRVQSCLPTTNKFINRVLSRFRRREDISLALGRVKHMITYLGHLFLRSLFLVSCGRWCFCFVAHGKLLSKHVFFSQDAIFLRNSVVLWWKGPFQEVSVLHFSLFTDDRHDARTALRVLWVVQICCSTTCLDTVWEHRVAGMSTPAVCVQMVCSCAWVWTS